MSSGFNGDEARIYLCSGMTVRRKEISTVEFFLLLVNGDVADRSVANFHGGLPGTWFFTLQFSVCLKSVSFYIILYLFFLCL